MVHSHVDLEEREGVASQFCVAAAVEAPLRWAKSEAGRVLKFDGHTGVRHVAIHTILRVGGGCVRACVGA